MTVRFKALWHLFIAELMKFGTVGGLAFLVNAGVVALLMATVFQDGGHLKAKAIATVVATLFSWLANRWWTFRHRRSEPVTHEFALFVVFNALGLLIALACLGFSRYVLGLDSQLADNVSGNGVGLVLGTLFRFWAYRTFVFRGELDLEGKGQGVVARGR